MNINWECVEYTEFWEHDTWSSGWEGMILIFMGALMIHERLDMQIWYITTKILPILRSAFVRDLIVESKRQPMLYSGNHSFGASIFGTGGSVSEAGALKPA